jgi:hypothetical protein
LTRDNCFGLDLSLRSRDEAALRRQRIEKTPRSLNSVEDSQSLDAEPLDACQPRTHERESCATMDAKFTEERSYVNLDRAFSEIERPRDLLVGPALHNEVQNFSLPEDSAMSVGASASCSINWQQCRCLTFTSQPPTGVP